MYQVCHGLQHLLVSRRTLGAQVGLAFLGNDDKLSILVEANTLIILDWLMGGIATHRGRWGILNGHRYLNKMILEIYEPMETWSHNNQ